MKLILVLVLSSFSLFNESKAKYLSQTKAPPLVGIYYNPFNDNSINFIKSQGKDGNGIFDLMLPNSTNLQVNFVPWSNANTVTANNYSCPDEDDCSATRIHACAINQHKDNPDGNNQIFHFILCTMSSDIWKSNASDAAVQCVNQVGEWPDDGEYLVECALDKTESDPLLDQFKAQADNAKVTQVPWVTINDVRNENAEKDLKTEVCNSFNAEAKPDACPGSGQPNGSSSTTAPDGSALEVGIFYNPFDDNSIALIKNQQKNGNGIFDLMLPGSKFLKIDFVPWSNANNVTKAYTCPDDENCLATRLHACAINQHKDNPDGNNQIFHFILCTMSSDIWKSNATESVVQCVNQIGEWPDDGEYLDECALDKTESDPLLDQLKAQADKAGVSQVPWVTFNGDRNEKAESDLKSEVCNSLNGTPDACKGSGATEIINSKIFLFVLIIIAIFTNNN